MPFPRLRVCLAGLLLAGLSTSLAATFTESTAPAPLRKLYANRDYRFGYLTVPQTHSQPAGRQIQLAVLILKAKTPGGLPIIYLNGGPGGIATDTAAFFEVFDGLQANHDVVLIDQRGTGYSEPFLRVRSRFLSQLPAENASYLSQGIDVSAYNTTENAADIAELRTALGYNQVILFGNSYGTFLGQEVMRSHPQGIAAAVMNGVSPAPDSFIPSYNANTLHGLNALFSDVERTPAARRAFPQLRRTYFGLLTRLRSRPLRLDDGFRVTASNLQNAMIGMLQSPERIALVPAMIRDIAAGRGNPFIRRVLTRNDGPRDFAYGMYLSCLGTDWNQPGWRQQTVSADRKLRPAIFRDLNAPDSLSIVNAVQAWSVPFNPRVTRQPLQSTIPTLLLSGAMEAQTPPKGAAQVAAGLPNSFLLAFPRSGHITGFTPGPAMQAILQFVNDPARKPVYSLGSLRRANFYKTSLPPERRALSEDAPLYRFQP